MLVTAMLDAKSYPHPVVGAIEQHETHISRVFLAGEFAYKIKKPIVSDFLDYSSAEKRHDCCVEELRLNQRYADDLYENIAVIRQLNDQITVDGPGVASDYAVRMKRFPESDVLSSCLKARELSRDEIDQLATSIASFHNNAAVSVSSMTFGSPLNILKDAMDNLQALSKAFRNDAQSAVTMRDQLKSLSDWTAEFHRKHQDVFRERQRQGRIRECHGDLHLSNIVRWNNRWVPFDGIEFRDEFRWIDVLNDIAFLKMDFAASGRSRAGQLLINTYLQETGDYRSLQLLQWYTVYRALVRAKVAAMRADQQSPTSEDYQHSKRDCESHIQLAFELSQPVEQFLWITHGLSGSGKSRGSEQIAADVGALRIRSDSERKRLLNLMADEQVGSQQAEDVYSRQSTNQIYEHLRSVSGEIIKAGFPVIVDATFLKSEHRDAFRQLADSLKVPFGILHFDAELHELRRRLILRKEEARDPSDADTSVLDLQIASQNPLTAEEQALVVAAGPLLRS